jgi:ankyrin repeat protein
MRHHFTWRAAVIRAVQFGAAMALVLWPLGGWAQQQVPEDSYGVKFEKTTSGDFSSRPVPAKVTTEEESALESKGYVKLGTITDASERTGAVTTGALREEILGKAAEVGGDVVRFDREGVPAEGRYSAAAGKGSCIERTTEMVPDYKTGLSKPVSRCTKWAPIYRTFTGTIPGLMSEGTVWRSPAAYLDSAPSPKDYVNWDDILKVINIELDTGKLTEVDVEAMVSTHPDWINLDYPDTLLGSAAFRGRKDVVEVLLAHGANVNAADNTHGWTPLSDAVMKGHKDVVEVLLAHGANVNAADKDGRTPLFGAVNKELVEVLLAHGVNAKNEDGETPLFLALRQKNKGVVEVLLTHGADVNAATKFGWTPLFEAVNTHGEEGFKELVEVLLAHGADVNVTDRLGETPLFVAVSWKLAKELVEILLAHGADVNVTSKFGGTALQQAAAADNQDCVELLRQHGARK